MKRILAIFICIIMTLNCVLFNASASVDESDGTIENKVENVNSLEISAKSAVLMDAET